MSISIMSNDNISTNSLLINDQLKQVTSKTNPAVKKDDKNQVKKNVQNPKELDIPKRNPQLEKSKNVLPPFSLMAGLGSSEGAHFKGSLYFDNFRNNFLEIGYKVSGKTTDSTKLSTTDTYFGGEYIRNVQGLNGFMFSGLAHILHYSEVNTMVSGLVRSTSMDALNVEASGKAYFSVLRGLGLYAGGSFNVFTAPGDRIQTEDYFIRYSNKQRMDFAGVSWSGEAGIRSKWLFIGAEYSEEQQKGFYPLTFYKKDQNSYQNLSAVATFDYRRNDSSWYIRPKFTLWTTQPSIDTEDHSPMKFNMELYGRGEFTPFKMVPYVRTVLEGRYSLYNGADFMVALQIMMNYL